MMESPEDILQLFDAKKIDEGWSFAGCKPSDTGKWSHSYHRYPAKFIPQLVEKLFDEYITNSEAHVNDPFCGCGTTIVTAISRGSAASGTDINRVAHLITKVIIKINQISVNRNDIISSECYRSRNEFKL